MEGGDDKRSSFKSSRDGLRRSMSSPGLLPRVSSGQRLWGAGYDEDDGDPTLQRILKENRARRAPRSQFVGLEGTEWRIEGWERESGGNALNVFHDTGKLSQGVTILRCSGATITVANKCSHVSVNSCRNTKVRVKGVISSVEVVHCEGLELTVGNVPVVQIDLSRDVLLLFADNDTRPKIVHASSSNLAAGLRGAAPERIVTAAFGEQLVTYYRRNEATKAWELADIATDRLKSSQGYVELAGVSGSLVDLADLEKKALEEAQHATVSAKK